MLQYRQSIWSWLCAGLALLFPLGAQASVQDLAWQDGVPSYQEVKGTITHDGPKLIFRTVRKWWGKPGLCTGIRWKGRSGCSSIM